VEIEGRPALQTMECWGRWQLLRPLVQSRLSTLWQVWDGERYGCLKRVRLRSLQPALRQEAQLLSQLSPPWVADAMLVEQQGEQALVMEFLQGEMFCRRHAAAGQHWQTLLKAIESLHQLGWIHGDLKPENLLITSAGELRLFDLGAAQPINGHYPQALQFTPGLTHPSVKPGERVCPQHDLYTLVRLAALLLCGHPQPDYPQLRQQLGWWRGWQLSRLLRREQLTFTQLASIFD